ncbi:hydroxymyristoyl-ACP dehydratase [Frateuria defendens]|uniref:hydroxymyristoyl-ACP dehydratase n=1 Tax=Frateuria defendens TaxID=2219559 RepID=UPI00066FD52E|nr:hydroxymyristoyl-ACP dehydratase [Frateuria defendens]
MSTTRFQTALCIGADHPCLPGHFPGDPLVPGVLLLDEVATALRAWRGQRLAKVAEAKFVAPLRPAQRAELTLTEAGARVRFEIRLGEALLARGLVEGAPA